jgi:nucleotide-binding universal stress UspA family protein
MSEEHFPRGQLGDLHLHRMLVAIDGSENAELALSAAVVAAQRDHARLTLIGVALDVAGVTPWAGVDPERMQREVDAEVEAVLRDAVARIPNEIPVTTIFRHGRAGPEIVAEAARGDYDAILLGARGLGRVAALMGSVSHHVLHHADITVFVAHAPRDAPGLAP